MFRTFPSGHWDLGWCHIHGAWAALVSRLDRNGAKEAGKDVPAKEHLLEPVVPVPSRSTSTQAHLQWNQAYCTPKLLDSGGGRSLKSHLVSSSSCSGVPTSSQLPHSWAVWGRRDYSGARRWSKEKKRDTSVWVFLLARSTLIYNPGHRTFTKIPVAPGNRGGQQETLLSRGHFLELQAWSLC